MTPPKSRVPAADYPLAAVLGHPVSHSLSPAIFAYLARTLHTNIGYGRLDVPPPRLRELFRVSRDLGVFRGWNITIPHKEAIWRLVDELSPAARAIGAVNVVAFEKGVARGHNTDWLGAEATWREARLRLRGASAVLYGAGGAARAVAFALGKQRVGMVNVVNRSVKRGEKFCGEFRALFPQVDFRLCAQVSSLAEEVSLLVNSTPVGMKGVPGTFRFPPKLSRGALAFDLIYRPPLPVFLRQAKSRGLRTVNGLDMLIWQAIATWEIWFGPLGERKRNEVKRALKRRLF